MWGKVTEQELKDFRAGKPVRAKVAEEAARRGMNNSGKKAASAIRRHIKKNVNKRPMRNFKDGPGR